MSSGATSVSGPGQNCSASMRALSGHDATTLADHLVIADMHDDRTGSSVVPLTSKMRATASASSAFAPSP